MLVVYFIVFLGYDFVLFYVYRGGRYFGGLVVFEVISIKLWVFEEGYTRVYSKSLRFFCCREGY